MNLEEARKLAHEAELGWRDLDGLRGLVLELADEVERVQGDNKRLKENWNSVSERLRTSQGVFEEIKAIQNVLSDIHWHKEES